MKQGHFWWNKDIFGGARTFLVELGQFCGARTFLVELGHFWWSKGQLRRRMAHGAKTPLLINKN